MNDERDDRTSELLGLLREEHRAPPDLLPAVMRRIERASEARGKRALDWLLRPRTVRISPAMAGLAAAAVAIALLRPSEPEVAPAGPADAGPVVPTVSSPATLGGAAARVTTRFVFVAPEARSVRITGDFVGWDPEGVPLEDPRGSGTWTVDLPLPPGVHQYVFILDGTEWRADPRAVSHVDDGFGQRNSVVIVPGNGAT